MKTLIAVLLLAASGIASAGSDYSQAVALQEYCDTISELANVTFDYRSSKLGTREEFFATNGRIEPGTRNPEIYQFAYEYGWDKATSKENAKRMTWAYCMDNAH